MTVSLTQPMASDWTQIYLYVAGQSYKRWNKGEVPADIAVDSISDCQMGELNRLKSWLYHQMVKARQEKGRAERRQEKEEAKAQREGGGNQRYLSSEASIHQRRAQESFPGPFLRLNRELINHSRKVPRF